MGNYKDLFRAGNKAQTEQMECNRHKRGWQNFPIHDSYQGIKMSGIHLQDYLFDLFTDKKRKLRKVDYKEVRKKAANIANFAHMIILKCDKVISEDEAKS